MFRYLAAFLILLASCANSIAQDRQDSPIQRLEGTVVVDGVLDEEAWQAIDPLPLVMYEPVYRGEMSENTVIKVAYDRHHLYVGGMLYHRDPGDIRVNSLYRDRYSEDDTFAIVIDPFNDNQNARWFFTNPAGVRFDMAVSNDADFSGGRPINSDWNTHWKVETTRTEEGWFAEMRIPFSSLGLQVNGENAEIGFTVYRYMAKAVERHIYPPIPPKWNMAMAKPSQSRDVVLEGVESESPIYVTPYLLGGLEQEARLNATETDYGFSNNFTREAGFDIKYNVSSNFTVDATFNTDFAQVEADNQQVNLTRFPLFFPEKRQFFQERSSLFSFGLGGRDQLFFSRRIGLDSHGRQIRIWGGGRLTGRTGKWDVGLINMQTAESESLPSENFGVLRLKRSVFNENSYLGGILTSRVSTGGHNIAYGLDGVVRVAGDEYATLRYAQTFHDGLDGEERWDPADTGFLRVDWSRRLNEGFYYSASFARSGRNFNPGVGFVTRRDYTSGGLSLSYGHLTGEESGIRRWDITGAGDTFFRNRDGSLETGSVSARGRFDFVSGARLNTTLEWRHEDLRRDISFLPGTEVHAGQYDFLNGQLRYEMRPSLLARTSLTLNAGSFYDGWRYGITAEPVWNLSQHLEVGMNYSFNALRFPDRDQSYEAHIVRLRTEGALNRRLSASTFVQYSNVAELVAANLRLRYNFGEGNDLWLVYNEQLNTSRDPLEPLLPRRPATQARALLLKFTYTFGL